MTGQEIIDEFFETVDDDTMDATRALHLANVAYDRVNTKRLWHYLDSTDSSKTIAAGTRSYALPSDFLYTRTVKLYSSSTKFGPALKPVPFRERYRYEGVQGHYYIDLKNSNLVLTYDPPTADVGKTIYHDYAYQPALLATNTSPVFNRAFHPLIVYEMGRMFWYGEQDEKDRSWNKEMKDEYDLMLSEMVAWDSRLDAGMEPDLMPQDQWLDLEDSQSISS